MAGIPHRGMVIDSVVRLLETYLHDRVHGFLRAKRNPLPDNPDPARGPDVMIFDQSPDGSSGGLLRLVVEILTPSDGVTLPLKRVLHYLKQGVPLVWVVEPAARSLVVYPTPWDPMVLDENDELTGNGVFPDLRIAVSQLFAVPGHG